jgi:hypothetical protein
VLSPLGDPVAWSHGMCHIWSPVAAGCGTRTSRSGRLIPYHGRIHLPLPLDVAWPGLGSHHSWTQASLPRLLVAHIEEALAEAPEQHGFTTMEIEVTVVEVAALTPSPTQSKVATSLPGCMNDASL